MSLQHEDITVTQQPCRLLPKIHITAHLCASPNKINSISTPQNDLIMC